MMKRHSASGLIVDRRELMAGAAALGLGLGFGAGPSIGAEAPKKGGTLKLGMEGGSASDSLDPRTYADSIPISYGWQIWNGLVEVDEKGDAVGELAESFEAKPGATTWIFNIRKGVPFTSRSSPIGIKPASTGVNRSALIITWVCKTSPEPAPARLK